MMNKIASLVLGASFVLAGVPAPAHAQGLSATRSVIAILADDLFVGEAVGHLNGAGTLAIRSQMRPALTCVGEFTSSAEAGGVGQLKCSDGAVVEFRFRRLTVFRGHGVGNSSRGTLSFAYGLSAEEARPYLQLPAGKTLMHNGTELVLN